MMVELEQIFDPWKSKRSYWNKFMDRLGYALEILMFLLALKWKSTHRIQTVLSKEN